MSGELIKRALLHQLPPWKTYTLWVLGTYVGLTIWVWYITGMPDVEMFIP